MSEAKDDDTRIKEAVIEVFRDHGSAMGELVDLIIPAVKRITADNLPAFIKSLGSDNRDESLKILYRTMTGPELVEVKKKIAAQLEAAAEANEEMKAFANKLILGSMKLALSIALAGVGL